MAPSVMQGSVQGIVRYHHVLLSSCSQLCACRCTCLHARDDSLLCLCSRELLPHRLLDARTMINKQSACLTQDGATAGWRESHSGSYSRATVSAPNARPGMRRVA